MVRDDVAAVVESLCFGDVVEVDWLDASEVTGCLGGEGGFDTPVRSVGYFLGLKGGRLRYLVVAKEVILSGEAFHYNVIPLGMVERVRVLARDVLEPEARRVLRKFVRCLGSLCGKDGWFYC